MLSGVNRAVLWDTHGNYALSRLVFQRGIGLVYLIAFVCALNQFCPVLGEHGLLPVPTFVRQVPFRATPSLFFFAPKDWAFKAAAWCGIALSCPVIAGIADAWSSWMNALIWFAIRVLYLSFVNVGQIFYGFGWGSILLEAGFLSMFLGGRSVQTPMPVIWLLRWLEFRIMFGVGLIKLRGDACWRKTDVPRLPLRNAAQSVRQLAGPCRKTHRLGTVMSRTVHAKI